MGVEAIEVGATATTGARTITEADVVNFAGVSGDFNRLHTDAEFMAASPVGERLVHGALVFSVTTGLLYQHGGAGAEREVVALYGVDDLRFTAPVAIGDTVHAEVEVLGTEPHDHPAASGLVRDGVEVVNQDGDVVLACELLTLVA